MLCIDLEIGYHEGNEHGAEDEPDRAHERDPAEDADHHEDWMHRHPFTHHHLTIVEIYPPAEEGIADEHDDSQHS